MLNCPKEFVYDCRLWIVFLKSPVVTCLQSVTLSIRAEKDVGNMDQAHEGMVWSLAWHPLGHILCSGSNDHSR